MSQLIDLLALAALTVMVAGFLVEKEWTRVTSFGLLLAVLLIRTMWRRRKAAIDETAVAIGTRAEDERDAYFQLRAWAFVGQAATVASLMIAVLGAFHRPLWPWAVSLIAVVLLYHGSVLWQRVRG